MRNEKVQIEHIVRLPEDRVIFVATKEPTSKTFQLTTSDRLRRVRAELSQLERGNDGKR